MNICCRKAQRTNSRNTTKLDAKFSVYARDALHYGGNLSHVQQFTVQASVCSNPHSVQSLLLPENASASKNYDLGGSGDRAFDDTNDLVPNRIATLANGAGDGPVKNANSPCVFSSLNIGQLGWKINCQRTQHSGKGIELTIELVSRPVLPFRAKVRVWLEQILPEYCYNERLNLQHVFSEDDTKLGKFS